MILYTVSFYNELNFIIIFVGIKGPYMGIGSWAMFEDLR